MEFVNLENLFFIYALQLLLFLLGWLSLFHYDLVYLLFSVGVSRLVTNLQSFVLFPQPFKFIRLEVEFSLELFFCVAECLYKGLILCWFNLNVSELLWQRISFANLILQIFDIFVHSCNLLLLLLEFEEQFIFLILNISNKPFLLIQILSKVSFGSFDLIVELIDFFSLIVEFFS